jgi:predicted nucleic acid-binding protein
VVDASVLVSALVAEDVHHQVSLNWLRGQMLEGSLLVAPVLLSVEIGGAIARRTGDTELGHRAVAQLQRMSSLRLVSIDRRLGQHATELAINLRLRGADAVYVAVADQLSLPLISWDVEQRERASARVEVASPQ